MAKYLHHLRFNLLLSITNRSIFKKRTHLWDRIGLNHNDHTNLSKRNKNLLRILIENDIKGKDVDELQLSIEKDYLRRFWIGFKG